jgi:hypothetical protein
MESSRAAVAVICVSPGLQGRWDVSEKGCDEPIATFEYKEDAYAYAIDLSRARQKAAVLVEDDEGFSPLALPEDGSGGPNPDSYSRG